MTSRGNVLSTEAEVKQQVRDFYDSVGWRSIGDGLYQNARYEDLRPVSREYIHRCHLRVSKHIPNSGNYLLDAGSGPIQYPEYLEYSKGFGYRVCLDISMLALKEARQRIGDHGMYVVGDIANLPFKSEVFKGVISLHTIHHLPSDEHKSAFFDLQRTLQPSGRAAIVYSWGIHSPLMKLLQKPISMATRVIHARMRRKLGGEGKPEVNQVENDDAQELISQPGTFTFKHDYHWIKTELIELTGLEIRVWRSVSTAFMRAFIHRKLAGKFWLRLIYAFEEIAPRYLGRIGQYPLILFQKPASKSSGER